jgi:hypothetical protein
MALLASLRSGSENKIVCFHLTVDSKFLYNILVHADVLSIHSIHKYFYLILEIFT